MGALCPYLDFVFESEEATTELAGDHLVFRFVHAVSMHLHPLVTRVHAPTDVAHGVGVHLGRLHLAVVRLVHLHGLVVIRLVDTARRLGRRTGTTRD